MPTIHIRGLNRVTKMLVKLPKATEQELKKVNMRFMKFVQKSAKLRAPRMTGRLAESIVIKKSRKNEIRLVVESPYGIFQEKGFAPHWIHSTMSDRIGGTVGGLFNRFNSFFFVTKHTPFVAPALESGLNRLPQMLSHGIKKAIQRARK